MSQTDREGGRRRRRRRRKRKTLLTRRWESLRGTPFIFITKEDRNFLAVKNINCAHSSFW
jgi:hypothetical protein